MAAEGRRLHYANYFAVQESCEEQAEVIRNGKGSFFERVAKRAFEEDHSEISGHYSSIRAYPVNGYNAIPLVADLTTDILIHTSDV
ncbi:hypothetical protein [Rhodohalobacter mucosus]|uniref:hypothetical protein n=1 Tax=Rhodohalobacter mucosus TaxID=2079485 RepID=UPI000D6C1D82|nr:hypothetical protein [Rhodohalobacter mucosus]